MKSHSQAEGAARSSGRSAEISASIVGCIGAEDFAIAALERIHPLVALGAWTVYRIQSDAPPEFSLGATRGRQDITEACWERYRSGLYRSDHSFDAMQADPQGGVAMSRLDPGQLAPAHRAAIYDRHAIQERLSLVTVERPGSLLALNFYRFAGQHWFSADEEADLLSSAAMLVTAVKRHLELAAVSRPAPPTVTTQDLEISVLRERCPRLTERELEVCMGLVQGWSFDGIAARLNLSAATVKTYRDRAFRRLGINHRNQLYGVCVAGVVEKTSQSRSVDA
ncbi:helix-turn-helix transcriptional regulator [Pseudorhodoferax sp. Leaf267]|uniref:helix-turn-helix transcriptional regulator n=1 Tax=Pseudorhodoferax sp. Leaf267 TaxID=1736316 RepID=UPI0007127A22|nr:helix-turn-helix transcriptional regulator [Pseudorhodoferax sp. Leaf267]KQP23465.1 hypothetical protein ASF43_06295 [Pseudorhodoferax sp. Leaf267]